jgi:elongator complex protein 3
MTHFSINADYSAKVNHELATWEELETEQKINETALSRCVGLVIETRPDNISEEEVLRVRRLGATKTQIGFQSLNDEVLDLNKRGHDVAATIRAIKLLRSAGFKIHGHWMANLYGSTPEMDIQDYQKLFTPDFQPDELKVYPCSLIETAELFDYYKKGLWHPFTEKELLNVLVHSLTYTPRYTRLTRVIRDIPSQDIVVGNKKTNFRQLVENEIAEKKLPIKEIRAREIRQEKVSIEDLSFKVTKYKAKNASGDVDEYFLEYVTNEDKICGFLRLSIPKNPSENFIDELRDAAIIREVHVYGQAQNIGAKSAKNPQHIGLGRKLMQHAFDIAKENNFKKISVISAIGTREYYRKNGFTDGQLYQHKNIE